MRKFSSFSTRDDGPCSNQACCDIPPRKSRQPYKLNTTKARISSHIGLALTLLRVILILICGEGEMVGSQLYAQSTVTFLVLHSQQAVMPPARAVLFGGPNNFDEHI
jgi:hypothetical protein